VRRESELFDYVGFERRFRGDPEQITAMLLERYGTTLAAHPPVLDVGCGRGELLDALAAKGVEVEGVDTDPGMVSEARARGLTVHQAGAVEHLRAREPGSLGAIIATHVLEHLELDYLVELLELAASRLRPGGVFIAETPNPATLVVLGSHFILDPTHVWPLHPALLNFLCESAGFRDVRLGFYSPATDLQLPRLDDAAAPEWARPLNAAIDRLNDVLFGAQDYSVTATTPT
jgi:SAM-dependent methyltransferase